MLAPQQEGTAAPALERPVRRARLHAAALSPVMLVELEH
jgi:hypothetical protein